MRSVRQWVGETTGGLPRQFWYLWTNTLINRVGSFVLIVLALYLTQKQGFSEAYAGLVIGLFGAGGALGTLLGGVLADRWGRKPTILLGLYASAATMLVLGFIGGRLATAVTVVVLGVWSESARPALMALMVDIVPDRDRLRAFSLNYWAINLGFACAALLGGLVASVDFRLLFILDAATTVAAATLVAVKITEPVRSRKGPLGGSAPIYATGLGEVFRDKVFMAYVGVSLLMSMVFMQHLSTLPLSMSRDGLSPSTYGGVIALNGVLIVAGQLFIPRLLRGMRQSTALAAGALIVGLGFGLTTFADAPIFYAMTVLVWTVGEMITSPSNSQAIAQLAPADLRGRYQGVNSLSWSVATFLAPILGATILQYAGAPTLWLGCFGLAVVVAAIHVAAGPSRERRAAQVAALTAAPKPTPLVEPAAVPAT